MIFIPTFRSFITPGPPTLFPAAQTDMLLWLNASNIVASNGDSLNFWTDDSTFHRTVTASTATAANQPKYKTNIINGKPAVLFGTSSFSLAPFPTASAQSSSAELWLIFQSSADPVPLSTHEGPVFMRSGSSGAEAVPFTDGKLYEPFYSAQSVPNVHTIITKSVVLTIPSLYNVLSENRHMSIRHRGELIYSSDNNPVPAGGAWGALSHSIGAEVGALWPGYISELIVYGRKLTDAERITTNNYLVNKYNVVYIPDSASLDPRTYHIGSTQSLTGWWDANNITGSNSSSISSWPDMSGNANNLTQSISGSQPYLFTSVYSGSSTATVRFTSSAYYMATTTPFAQVTNAPFTFMTVCKARVSDGSVLSSATANIQFRIRRANTNENDFFPGNNELIADFSNQPVGSFQLNVWTRTSGSSGTVNMWQNGQKVAAGTNASSFTWNRVADGTVNTVPLIGDISELVWFNYELNDFQIFKLYDLYFRTKWGLPGGNF